mmetsp:Transcript_11152/g.21577  ORF Transcript_11152/g.21577 Transcript_11152/m.21577 type:complete len:126 (-) Transcript_11152:178-555(-)
MVRVEVVDAIVLVFVLFLAEVAITIDVCDALKLFVEVNVVLVAEVNVRVCVLVDNVLVAVNVVFVAVVGLVVYVCVRVGDLEVSAIRELELLDANVPLQTARCRQHHSIWSNDQSCLQSEASSHS